MQQLKSIFHAYAVGTFYASACTSLPDDEAANCMGNQRPGAWHVADENFADGRPNGVSCDEKPDSHRHVLFTR